MDNNQTQAIRDLYPHLTEDELAIAEDNLDRYLALVLRIFDRLEQAGQLTPNADALPSTTSGSASSGRQLPPT